jgi:hypothetical protein
LINADDIEVVTRVYRLQKLLAPNATEAAERTFKLTQSLAMPKDRILEIVAAEELRRAELIRTLRATEKDLAK